MIVYVTGGARSGKSRFAEKRVSNFGDNIAYIATAVPFDEGMKDRILKHQKHRPKTWKTFERYKDWSEPDLVDDVIACDGILLDCITIMITNLMMETHFDFDTVSLSQIDEMEIMIHRQIKTLIALINANHLNAVFVSNEVGLGLVPDYKMGNYFRDIAGRVNQYLADISNEAYFLVSGIPLKLK